MKVLLLAAGRSKRLKPIEDKNFLKFLGKPLIRHQIEALYKAGLCNLIVVGGKHNLVALKKCAGEIMKDLRGLKVAIVEQKDLEAGMAGAVLAAEKAIGGGPVFIVSANDVVDGEAYGLVLEAAKDKRLDGAMIGYKVKSYFPGGYLKVGPGSLIKGIVEKPGEGKEPSKMINLVLHFHRDAAKLIATLKRTKSSRDDRYESALDSLIKSGFKMKVVPYGGYWQAIKYPWHVISLMNRFLGKMPGAKTLTNAGAKGKSGKSVRCGKNVIIEKSAVVKGDVFIDDCVIVSENALIIGPAHIGKNSIISNNALVRESYIGNGTIIATGALVRGSQVGDNCVIGFASEVARSFVGDHVWTHTNYVGDSIIGNNCSFGAGTVTGNLRLDEADIPVNIGGWDCVDGETGLGKSGAEKISSGTNKFGLITGDNVRCGINTSFMPGVKIGKNCFIGAGIVVAQDVADNKFVYGKTELVIKDNLARSDMKKRTRMKNKLKATEP